MADSRTAGCFLGQSCHSSLSLEELIGGTKETSSQELIVQLFALHVSSGYDAELFDDILRSLLSLTQKQVQNQAKISLTKGDLFGDFSFLRRNYKKVQNELEEKRRLEGIYPSKKEKAKRHPLYGIGTLSHFILQGLMNGRLPDRKVLERYKYEPQSQLRIFSTGNEEDNVQQRFSELSAHMQYLILKNGEITVEYLDVLKTLLNYLLYCKKAYEVEKLAEQLSEEFENLKNIMLPVIGELSFRKLEEECFRQRDVLYFLYGSLMMWAQAFIFAGPSEGRSPLFTEIPALNTAYGTIGGRIDGVRVLSIDRKPLEKFQLVILNQLARSWYQEKNKSAGYLVARIRRLLGEPEFEILEFKFCFGDGGYSNPIQLSQVLDGPINAHREQTLGYLALASFDAGEQCFQNGLEGLSHSFFRQAEIIYFFDSAPVCHRLELDEGGLKDAFFEQFSARWGASYVLELAQERQVWNSLVNMAKAFYRGDDFAKKLGPVKSKPVQLRLFPDQEEKDSLGEAAELTRRFITRKYRFIESFRNGNQTLGLHYNLLCQLIKRKKISADEFSPEVGGYVECLIKGHGKSQVRMLVDLRQGIFHCPHCQLSGNILSNSIPRELKKNLAEAEDLLAPERYLQVIQLMQRVLEDSFSRSKRAQAFFTDKGLDLDLISAQPVGYGDFRSLEILLEMGVEFTELVAFGLISFSSAVSKNSRLFQMLLAKGLKSREIQKKGSRPIFRLNGQLTLPMSLPDGRMVSFCGINIESGALHALKAPYGLSTGAVNMEVLPKTSELAIVKGPLRYLSLLANEVATVGIIDPRDQFFLRQLVVAEVSVVHDGLSRRAETIYETDSWLFQEALLRQGFKGQIRRLCLEEASQRKVENYDEVGSLLAVPSDL